jgi:hypothetical protein
MTVVTVTHADQSKAGKQRIYVGGKNNWQDAIYVGQRCASVPSVGATIDAQMTSKTFQDGRTTWFLNSWQPVNGAPTPYALGQASQPYVSTPSQQAPAKQELAPAQQRLGWPDLPTGDMLRWVSNVVGSAIAANLIKTPSDISMWVGASYRAAESLRKGDVPEFDSDVPRFVEPDPAEQQGHDEGEPPYGDEQQPGDPF